MEAQKAKIIDSAVANYSSQPGYLKKDSRKKADLVEVVAKMISPTEKRLERAWRAKKSDIW